MIKKACLSAALLISTSSLANQHEIEFYLTSNSFTDIAPVLQIADDEWQQGPQSDASMGFSQSRVGIAYQYQSLSSLRWHIMQRIDYHLVTNPHTALGYYQEQNELPLTSYDEYDVEIELVGSRNRGLGVEYQEQIGQLAISIQANYWQLNYLRHSNVSGTISGKEDLQLLGNLEFEEFYTDNNFLKRPNSEGGWQTSGDGYSLDIAFTYKLSDTMMLYGEFVDLINRFEVTGVGYTKADINTKGSFVDNVGFSSFRPLLKGIEKEQSFEFDLNKQIQLGLDYAKGPFVYHLNTFKQGDRQFTQLGVSEGAWGLLIDPVNKVVDIKYQGESIDWQLGLDQFNPNDALAIRVGFSGKFAW
ncbi:hypothetical protein [Pseudoalteromonas phenolica]|uniref:TonB-dependent receptor n=1 Tax=Pseudoalteromonas phenolica TaxID=161398 RepID=A0A0S2K5N4_9GAMM|nr:hypothetical protein [Pseudoalteromonas phenolica]ALO43347.1 hypothetical protein PP2015_2862 [Pseudoalteromonas phenolica]MBE0355495.1 hypothetical protein [Pseudoalteromonas phenolica O-BC30]RXF05770.1 hypothetical protein D9981_02195 [Pseudoalteromonas phenolica O-BC30]